MPVLKAKSQPDPRRNSRNVRASVRQAASQRSKRNHDASESEEETSDDEKNARSRTNGNRRGQTSRNGHASTSRRSTSGSESNNGQDSSSDDQAGRSRRLRMAKKLLSTTERQSRKEKAKAAFKTPGKNGVSLSKEEMITNTLVYLLSRHNRLHPFTRADLVKDAMNGQSRAFDYVLKIIDRILQKEFLMKLVGYERANTKAGGFSSYILVSLVPTTVINGPDDLPKSDPIKGFLGLLLTFIFMGESPIYDDAIWTTIAKMELEKYICNEGDLRKFLKTEYVSKQYLTVEEEVSLEGVVEKCKYGWGLRSEYEFSKLEMLKRVAKNCGNGDLQKFRTYPAAMKQIELQGKVLNQFRNVESISDIGSEHGDLDDDDDDVPLHTLREKSVSTARKSVPAPPEPTRSKSTRSTRNQKGSKKSKKRTEVSSDDNSTLGSDNSTLGSESDGDDNNVGYSGPKISQAESEANTQGLTDDSANED